jgi:hypothetical protein
MWPSMQTYFSTSKFHYFTFFSTPPIKLKLGQDSRYVGGWGTTNRKPPGPIIMTSGYPWRKFVEKSPMKTYMVKRAFIFFMFYFYVFSVFIYLYLDTSFIFSYFLFFILFLDFCNLKKILLLYFPFLVLFARHRHLALEHFRPGAAHFGTSFLSSEGLQNRPRRDW